MVVNGMNVKVRDRVGPACSKTGLNSSAGCRIISPKEAAIRLRIAVLPAIKVTGWAIIFHRMVGVGKMINAMRNFFGRRTGIGRQVDRNKKNLCQTVSVTDDSWFFPFAYQDKSNVSTFTAGYPDDGTNISRQKKKVFSRFVKGLRQASRSRRD
ncbi:hypothetical protein SAMN05660330_00859 [Desulforhopalus singaporensis]|uniref:Uncharacterized protein n=1 Tax=Desulforhopalus singaporensis TaxID=91360 RepID=A0A1H0LUH2_9BACT|nr:hypothetical protein SAMN05660330_00859 [Desulforhopalus singaporensis]